MKLIKTITAVTAVICCAAITSQATLILPGSNGSALGALTVGGGATVVTGGSLAAQTLLVGSGTQTIFGTISSTVYTGDANNTFGGYTFVYVINMTSAIPANDTLETLSLSAFGGIGNIGVGYGAGYTPGTGALNGAGTLNISFDTAANSFSGMSITNYATIIVQTGVQRFGGGTANAINGSSPAAAILAVPEPTTMVAGAMLLLPFGASTLRFFRRKSSV